jgi:hypothetical protein
VVAALARSGEEWADRARRIESLGYSSLIVIPGYIDVGSCARLGITLFTPVSPRKAASMRTAEAGDDQGSRIPR